MKKYIKSAYFGKYRGYNLCREDDSPQRFYTHIGRGNIIFENSIEDLRSAIDDMLNDSDNSRPVKSSVELDDRFSFDFSDIGTEIYIDTMADYAQIFYEDEKVIGNGAGVQYSIIVAIPDYRNHWQMKFNIRDSFERHLEDVLQGSDYTFSIISVTKCSDWPYGLYDELEPTDHLYRVVIEVVPYNNIGPYGEYGINYGVDDYIDSATNICSNYEKHSSSLSDAEYTVRMKQFKSDCEDIAEECEKEGYPSNGTNYELRVEDLMQSDYYRPLFYDDYDDYDEITV